MTRTFEIKDIVVHGDRLVKITSYTIDQYRVYPVDGDYRKDYYYVSFGLVKKPKNTEEILHD